MAKKDTNTAAADAGNTAPQANAADVAGFPRDVKIINEGPAQYVVGNKHVIGFSTVTVTVNSNDEIVRLQADIEALMGLNPLYAELETLPLRLEDAAAGEDAAA